MLGAGATLAACVAPETVAPPTYSYAETLRLSEDLVNIRAFVDANAPPGTGEAYADCVAAEYALAQGFAFARHVRTTRAEEAGLLLADTVYTLSAAIPVGPGLSDAETTVAACRENGIPTV